MSPDDEKREKLFELMAKDFDAIEEYAAYGRGHALRGNEKQAHSHALLAGAHLRNIAAILGDLMKIRPSDESFEYGH
jgi:hypothetical protein